MKLVISVDEIKRAVADFMTARGFDIQPANLSFDFHNEGEYEDREMVFDGMSANVNSNRLVVNTGE